MEKLSACRKRASSIHFFSSTRMRCIMAICPTGPPKLMQPIFSQTLKASAKVGFGPVFMSCRFLFAHDLIRKPVPTFRDHARTGQLCRSSAAKRSEQGIVDHEAAFEQPMIVVAGKHRQAECE